jgi:CubicO group peptidase (beta-lactamase class C family)
LENYLPELTANTVYSSVRLKDMMAHQAGFHPWIPFYTETLLNKKLNPKYYQQYPSDSFNVRVTENLYIMTNYEEEMYNQILRKPLKSKTYKYSDLGYYFVKKIVEKQTGQKLDEYVRNDFYSPMGLRYLCYNPADIYPLDQITPTENDTIFRRELIHGFVHDQGAAMMGGVGGHAGLFSNAGDLAALMQMYLNKGNYGGVQYIAPSVIEQYTSYQFYPSSRRGAGFDKPTTNGQGGPTTNLVSKKSFGHSGFTGTLAWSDPEYEVNFVFLSNRVYPDAENWKIVKQNTRTEIQRVIYEAVLAAK